jgi:hypothetical protein
VRSCITGLWRDSLSFAFKLKKFCGSGEREQYKNTKKKFWKKVVKNLSIGDKSASKKGKLKK